MALAQSISIDGSTSTVLSGPNNCVTGDCTITGGLQDGSGSGPNLFHSFNRFNVETGATVTFTDPGVDNIFSRVTDISSLNASNIDGTLKVDGTANLFLLNPNGILFGNNATLDISGSFLSSTADSLLFQNGTTFDAISAEIPSLLSINVPLGLQYGSSPNPIEIQGNGHNLIYNRNSTITRGTPTTGLSASTGQTLAFLGGDVILQGGNVIAESGHIEIGSLGDNAVVNISNSESSTAEWNFDYSEVTNFRDINLSQQSSIDVSGTLVSGSLDVSDYEAGSVQLQGKQINLIEGSAILAQVLPSNLPNEPTVGGGDITLNASEKIELTGVNLSATNRMPTSVYIEIAPGAVGDGSSQLTVNTPLLNLDAGAQIGLSMAGQGTAGKVDINTTTIAADNGSNATPSSIFAGVLPVFGPPPGASGQGGDLNITTENLSITNGAQLFTPTFGAGNAGDFNVEATYIEVIGFNAAGSSSINSVSNVPSIPPLPSGSGDGGNLRILTEQLVVADGGQIAVSTASENSAGNLTVIASDSIELSGEVPQGRSGLFANAISGSGEGGNIQVETNRLSLLEGATINASNFASSTSGAPQGSGSAGNINVIATEIELKDDSSITTDTVSGDRANITLQSDSLVLRRGSNITANASTTTGGNLNIDTEALIAFENSDITANASQGFGGRVTITANTILGTAFRDQLTTESDITASSDLGPAFSGTVELNRPSIDPTEGLSELPENLAAAEKIVAACEKLDSNTFVATGRGGLPSNTSQLITSQSVWNDFRLLGNTDSLADNNHSISHSELISSDALGEESPQSNLTTTSITLLEAQSWSRNDEGTVVLGVNVALPYSETHASTNCLANS
ncbi:MAG: filamentous hemagglutinin N-terminal domain-containing protein [Leptolyngbyaceae cyanobacterium MAG.088]|nr:filamentous hemagglutinin N-terminal domain-containing protein [Leptolyngbyaceae cyanobacterium MAG.088]